MRALRPFLIAGVVLITVAALSPVPACAETFLDVYAGGAFPADSDTTDTTPGGFRFTLQSEYKDSFLLGGRVGLYFDRLPWFGLALDVSYFKADIDLPDGAKNDVVPISLLALGRIPLLISREFPLGRLQPYVGAGVSVVYSRSDTGGVTDTSWDPGFDFRLGLTWMINRTIGLFGEYRFTYVNPTYEFSRGGLTEKIEPEYSVNHLAGGLTFRF